MFFLFFLFLKTKNHSKKQFPNKTVFIFELNCFQNSCKCHKTSRFMTDIENFIMSHDVFPFKQNPRNGFISILQNILFQEVNGQPFNGISLKHDPNVHSLWKGQYELYGRLVVETKNKKKWLVNVFENNFEK